MDESQPTSPNATPPTLINKKVEEIRREAIEVIDNLYEEVILKTPNNKLPERIFKNTFAPYFLGDKSLVDDKNIITTWVAIAGNPSGKVDIIDDAGNTVFTVPPLFDTENVDATGGKDSQFSNLAFNYNIRAANIPALGEKYLEANLLDSQNKILNNKLAHTNDYRKMWENIHDRYKPNDKANSAKKNLDKPNDDELIYD